MNFTLILVILLVATGGVWLAGWAWARVRGVQDGERPV
nr:signal peptidase I [Gemmatimonadota bacterium]NIX39396.1 signal peptidase I [Gemmatimonadota bacterium]